MKRILCALLVLLLAGGCAPGQYAADTPASQNTPSPTYEIDTPSDAPVQRLRHGRSFLSESAATVYDALCEAAATLDWNARIAVPAAVSAAELEQMLGWLASDNPRFYWLTAVLDETGGERALLLDAGTLTRDEVAARDTALEQAAADLLARLPADADARTTVFALHDLLIEHTAYERDDAQPDIGNAYGGLVRGRAVCDGFARSYQYLLEQAGIDNIYISGSSHRGVSHAWNAVLLDDGWHYVDVTWDSVASSPGMITHEYLCVTHEEMALQHFPDSAQYPALPEESHPGGSYYETHGSAVDAAAPRAALAEAFARQLAGRVPDGGEQLVYLEIKVIAPAADYERARERFVNSLYELLSDMDQVIRREGWPIRIRTDGEILCSYNDAVQVLVLYPRAERIE